MEIVIKDFTLRHII